MAEGWRLQGPATGRKGVLELNGHRDVSSRVGADDSLHLFSGTVEKLHSRGAALRSRADARVHLPGVTDRLRKVSLLMDPKRLVLN